MALPRLTYGTKTNPKPVVDRNKQATAEDFNDIKNVVNQTAAVVDSISPLSVNGVTFLKPLDAHQYLSASATGAIKITIPNTWNYSFIKLEIEVYDLIQNESFTIKTGGYLFADVSNPSWVATYAQIITSLSSNNHPVRFGHDGTKCCIYIGELSSGWSYANVSITSAMICYSNIDTEKWLTGWDISTESSAFQNVTQTHTNNLPVAQ